MRCLALTSLLIACSPSSTPRPVGATTTPTQGSAVTDSAAPFAVPEALSLGCFALSRTRHIGGCIRGLQAPEHMDATLVFVALDGAAKPPPSIALDLDAAARPSAETRAELGRALAGFDAWTPSHLPDKDEVIKVGKLRFDAYVFAHESVSIFVYRMWKPDGDQVELVKMDHANGPVTARVFTERANANDVAVLELTATSSPRSAHVFRCDASGCQKLE